MKIVLVLPSLACGGAEKAAILIAEGLLQRGYQVFAVTISGKETDFYQLANKVERIALDVGKKSPTLIHGIWNNISRIGNLRKTIKSLDPDVVISFLDTTNILTLLALTNTKYPVLVSEQNNPQLSSQGIIWDILRILTYRQAARVVSSSQGVDNYFSWLSKTKRAVIYNPLATVNKDDGQLDLPDGINPEKKMIISMGRLTSQKGFDILLSAFKKIAAQYQDWQLIILGKGELRSELENLRDNLGLTEQVIFPGIFSNPFPLLKQSKIFVLSSRFEGFGNVLIEAMACGLPVISTDCPSGPREIICDGVDGILVPTEDASALAVAMEHLICNEKERQRLAINALEGIDRFSLEKILDKWEELIGEITK